MFTFVFFRQFLSACSDGLELNSSLISTEQKEYHEAMKSGYVEMRAQLDDLLGEKVASSTHQLLLPSPISIDTEL